MHSKSFIAPLRLVQLDCLHDVHSCLSFVTLLFCFSCRFLLGLKFRASADRDEGGRSRCGTSRGREIRSLCHLWHVAPFYRSPTDRTSRCDPTLAGASPTGADWRCAKVPKASFVAFEARLVGKIRTLGARYYRTGGRRYNGINTEYVTQRGAQ
jgi:hypothetical protein